jgi:hypothetical protein
MIKTKAEIAMLQMFAVFSLILLFFFIVDLCTSYVNVCQVDGNSVVCGLKPVINLLPTF